MDNQLQSISKIFTEKLFRIPDYQRGYAWEEKQWKDFWSDIIQLENGRNHYVGVLTYENVPKSDYDKWKNDLWIIDSKSFAPYYIVDGQQRLTTTLILLQAITESIGDNKVVNFSSVDEIKKRYLFDSKDGGISKSYIFGYDEDNPSYEFLKTKIFNEGSSSAYLKEETIYTHNLIAAKEYFLERLKKLDFSEIETIFKKVTQHILFNIYTISSDIDVHVTFEGMNNRGKPLSVLELLKNRLIYLSTRFKADNHEKEKLRHSINSSWKSIYYFLGKNKENILDDDKFLLNHFIIYFGNELIEHNEEESMDDRRRKFARIHRYFRFGYSNFLLDNKFTLKNILSDSLAFIEDDETEKPDSEKLAISDIHNYVEDLSTSVSIWYDLFNPFQSSELSEEEKIWLDKLNRIDFSDFAPLIMVAYKTTKDKSKRLTLLKNIEKFKFIFGLAYRHRRYLGVPRFEYLSQAMMLYNKKITIEEVTETIYTDIKELLGKSDFLEGVRKDFQRHGFYRWDLINYFLFEYEEMLKSQSKTSRRKIDWIEFNEYKEDFITVEHVYPHKANKKCWSEHFKTYSQKEKDLLRHSIGNLLPLSKAKNSSLQNDCFLDKVSRVDKATIGYKYGSYSENEISSNTKWAPYEILIRGIKLIAFMEERWSVKIGNEANKIKFLGLDFVLKKEKSLPTTTAKKS
jgi:uncharacterized protein with ParB-like and HNH nuclease domain